MVTNRSMPKHVFGVVTVCRPYEEANGGSGVPSGELSRDQRSYERSELEKAGRFPVGSQHTVVSKIASNDVFALQPWCDPKQANNFACVGESHHKSISILLTPSGHKQNWSSAAGYVHDR